MKKGTIISIVTVVVLVLVTLLVVKNLGGNNTSSLKNESDIKTMINSIIKKEKDNLPSLDINTIDVKNKDDVSLYTGLKSNENVETLVVAEPLMSSQAFSIAVVKVNENANIESMKQEMIDNINTSKWICVTAEKVYVTNNGNVIFLVMADADWASLVYKDFKEYVNNDIGKELEKTSEDSFEPGIPVTD